MTVPADSTHGGFDDEPALRAEGLFICLTETPEPLRKTPRLLPSAVPPAAGPTAQVHGPPKGPAGAPTTDRSQAARNATDLVMAALTATDRIGEVVGSVMSSVDATTSELVNLGRAIEQAFQATNDRLAALERAVPGEGPGGVPVERALARLRSTYRQAARDAEGGPASAVVS